MRQNQSITFFICEVSNNCLRIKYFEVIFRIYFLLNTYIVKIEVFFNKIFDFFSDPPIFHIFVIVIF